MCPRRNLAQHLGCGYLVSVRFVGVFAEYRMFAGERHVIAGSVLSAPSVEWNDRKEGLEASTALAVGD